MKRLRSFVASIVAALGPLPASAAHAVIGLIAVLVVVNVGVLATWSSTHEPEPAREAGGWQAYEGAPEAGGDITAAAPPATDATVPAPTQPAAAARNAPATASAPAAQERKPAPIDPGDFAFDLAVSPACAPRLADMEATIRAVPGAYVSMIVAYSDGHSFGTMYAGPVREDGTFVLRWKVPATAATGTGHVLASAHDPATNTSGRNVVDFEVVEGKRC